MTNEKASSDCSEKNNPSPSCFEATETDLPLQQLRLPPLKHFFLCRDSSTEDCYKVVLFGNAEVIWSRGIADIDVLCSWKSQYAQPGDGLALLKLEIPKCVIQS